MKKLYLDKRERSNLCFMLSNWYSGATLLAILLNNHNEISCNGEIPPFSNDDIDDLICSCGSKLNSCEHYKNVGKELMHHNTNNWDRSIFQTLPNISKLNFINKFLIQFNYLPTIRDFIIKFIPLFINRITYFLDKQNKFIGNTNSYDNTSIYIDGTKSIRRAELFIKYSSSIKIIHLIRDGRGFCASFVKNKPKPMNTLDIASKKWNNYIKLLDKFSERYPEAEIFTVKYEDLCNNSTVILNQICDFLNIPYDPKILDMDGKQYHVLGNRMKGKFNGIINEDLSWKTKLDKSEITKITAVMYKNLKRFNYI